LHRAFLNSYIDRDAVARARHLRQLEDEAIYPVYFIDADQADLDGTRRLRDAFCAAAIAQAAVFNAFWSPLHPVQLPRPAYASALTAYRLINSPMLPNLRARTADVGLSLYVPADIAGRRQGDISTAMPAHPAVRLLRGDAVSYIGPSLTRSIRPNGAAPCPLQ